MTQKANQAEYTELARMADAMISAHHATVHAVTQHAPKHAEWIAAKRKELEVSDAIQRGTIAQSGKV